MKKPLLLSLQKIWDESVHNALTDLIRYKGKWLCVFREGDRHVGGHDGTIRILQSEDGVGWGSLCSLTLEGTDLRDPKLSITSAGRLMLVVGGTNYTKKVEYLTRQPMVAFSDEGKYWTPLQKVLAPHEWLWRVTWHKGKAYGVSYRYSNPEKPREEWEVNLFISNEGRDWELHSVWNIPGYPNETTLRVKKNDEMIALVRRDKWSDSGAWIGHSMPPYTDWRWHDTELYFGGPNFIITPNEELWGAGRILAKSPYGHFEKTVIAKVENEGIHPLLVLPSGGHDCSYPGMVFHEGVLWVSYYSSHERNTAIYLARVDI